MKRYNPKELEPKWQKIWRDSKIYEVDTKSANNKFYIIPMFPYPSGDMHIGHWYNFAPTDVIARWRRMLGYKVLHTNGFDAFGLPAENAAIKRGIPPAQWTKQNIASMTKQMEAIGASYDWTKFVVTCDPDYYRWTQWIFLELYKKGLAYRKKGLVNWCPKDQTVLANEQVIGENNVCERCGTPVIQKELEQWYFKITDYAQRLLDDLEKVDWPERVRVMQANWIGRSVGAEIDFKVDGAGQKIKVFTTRPDTIFGATFLVLAPEHKLLNKLSNLDNKESVDDYIREAERKSNIDRLETQREKTGVFTGSYATNPANDEKIPIWVADYVLPGYGTGAVMAVPAHDERDWQFAKKFDLPILETIEAYTFDEDNPPKEGKPNTKRSVAICVIKNSEGQYLTLKWNKLDWHNFVMGGVEDGEELVDAARREIAEETGYTDVEFKGRMPFALNSVFYATHKDVNRDIRVDVVMFELKSDKKIKVKHEAHEDFKPVWVEQSELKNLHPVGGLEYIVRWVEEGDYVYTGEGRVINSGKFNELSSSEAREKIVADLAKKGFAKEKINFKIHDWLISRQRYWGAPIPIVYCEKCGIQPIPENQLPVLLPENVQFEPTGQSPLLQDEDFVNTTCPNCSGPAKRETDTMDTFVDSSWYFLRYPNPSYKTGPYNTEIINKWAPVDHYIGGIEHAILHLLYARFITKFLYDHNGLKFDEPFKKLSNQGIILGPDGLKMSKRKGNVVNPDEQVNSYGADSLRLYMMFMGPYDQGGPYNLGGIAGTRRFLDRIWTLAGEFLESENAKELHVQETEFAVLTHKTIKKVTQDLERMDFNTAIAAMMSMVNELYKLKSEKGMQQSPGWRLALENLLLILAPFAPHITEELWQMLGHEESIHVSGWPAWEEDLVTEEMVTLAVQINGKVRAEIVVDADINEEDAISAAKSNEKVSLFIKDKKIKKSIYVPGRLVSLVL